MPETVHDILEEMKTRLAAISPADQYAEMITALQALGFGGEEMQAVIDGVADLITNLFDTDPQLAPMYSYMNAALHGMAPLQQRCLPVVVPTNAMTMLSTAEGPVLASLTGGPEPTPEPAEEPAP